MLCCLFQSIRNTAFLNLPSLLNPEVLLCPKAHFLKVSSLLSLTHSQSD